MPFVLENQIVSLPSVDYDDAQVILSELKEYKHPEVKVADSYTVPGQKALIAQEDIAPFTLIFTYTNSLSLIRTRTSIQIGEIEHIEAGSFGSFTNHSCVPNAVIRATVDVCGTKGTAGLISIKPIKKGEEITFDYATTESDLTDDLQKADCLCKNKNCRGKVKHFHQLTIEDQTKLFIEKLPAEHIFEISAR